MVVTASEDDDDLPLNALVDKTRVCGVSLAAVGLTQVQASIESVPFCPFSVSELCSKIFQVRRRQSHRSATRLDAADECVTAGWP